MRLWREDLPPQDRTGPHATGRMVTHHLVKSGERLPPTDAEAMASRAWWNGFIVGALAMGLAAAVGFGISWLAL